MYYSLVDPESNFFLLVFRVPKPRDYEKERAVIAVPLESTTTHPLMPNPPKPKANLIKTKSVSGKTTMVDDPLGDPLGALKDPLLNNDDHLSGSVSSLVKAESKAQIITNALIAAQDAHEENLKTPWQIKKSAIKNEYTITGNVTVKSSALAEFVGSGVEDGSSARKVDKYDKRLASLEKRVNSADDKIEISQKEYENHIDKLNTDLHKAWQSDDRVGTLKIAITLGKLLSDTSLPTFYPSMFVMVIDVLDKFRDLVYNRLLSKAEDSLNSNPASTSTNSKNKRVKLPANFTTQDIPALAKEICRNWFYKTSCIRELLPRIYVELSLLKCYKFLTDTDIPLILSRIGNMIRGIGKCSI
ncbi:hypothetical protein EON65_44355 [archaeon]|nr:MAG: hypothetical protein EON65_44355 [archaeon]